jgi:hypothetical protein
MRVFFVLAAAVLCNGAHAGELDASALRQTFVGQAILWWEPGGWHAGELALRPDGSAEIRVHSPSGSYDSGHWRIDGNRICTTWSHLRGSVLKCYTVQKVGPNRFLTSGGNVLEVMTAGVLRVYSATVKER